MWIARDKDEDLFIYPIKPYKAEDKGFWVGDSHYTKLPKDYFLEVSWEDEEPRELVLRPINK